MKKSLCRACRSLVSALEVLENRSLLAGDVTAGLTHRWTFDETSGDVAADVVGGNNATLANWGTGESKWVAGRFGGGLDFDGVDNLAITSANVDLNQYTASFWIKQHAVGNLSPRIVAPEDGFTGIAINDDGGNGLGVFSNGNFTVVDATRPTNNVWINYVVTVDSVNDVATIYRDGQQVATGTLVSYASTGKLIFGHNCGLPNQGDTFNGVIDDIRIYDRLLSGSEAKQLADFGKTVVVAGGTKNYTENQAAVALAPNAAVTDADSTHLGGSKLIASITANKNAADQFLINSDGTGSGQITLSGGNVLYQGLNIGTLTSAPGAVPLTVTFNANATPAGAQALVHHLVFQSLGDNLSVLQRKVKLEINDPSGVHGLAATVYVNVIPVNDAPVLDTSGNPTLPSIPEHSTNPSGTLVKSLLDGYVSDPDGSSAFSGIAITAGGGESSGHWQYSLNNGASWTGIGPASLTSSLLLAADAQTRVRFVPNGNFHGTVKLYYRAWDQTQGTPGGTINSNANSGGARSCSTAVENASITVTPVNDPPVLTLSGSVNYVHDSAAIVLASGATVTDPDSGNFSGGRLKVHISTGASSNNRLGLSGDFTVDASNNVKRGSIIIGTLNSNGGVGTTDLIVTFNSNSIASNVQALVRAITFQTVGGTAGNRSVVFSVSDGDGGVSADRTKTVQVS